MHLPHPNDWPMLIAAQQTSGLSVTEFCQKQNISARDFYLQHYQLHHDSAAHRNTQSSAFVRVEKSQHNLSREWRDTPEAPWVLLSHGQTQLKLPLSESPIWLSALLKELNS